MYLKKRHKDKITPTLLILIRNKLSHYVKATKNNAKSLHCLEVKIWLNFGFIEQQI
jgi:hypothetical protein